MARATVQANQAKYKAANGGEVTAVRLERGVLQQKRRRRVHEEIRTDIL